MRAFYSRGYRNIQLFSGECLPNRDSRLTWQPEVRISKPLGTPRSPCITAGQVRVSPT